MEMPSSASGPRRELSLPDSVSIIVGIIIGAGIFETAPLVAKSMPDSVALMWVWICGGVLSLIGAACYAELSSMFPHEGGEYHYLNRAFGNWLGYLFVWSRSFIIGPGSIAAMSYPFATYAYSLFPFGFEGNSAGSIKLLYGILSILLLTAINILGLREGKWTQNTLTLIKVVGLLAISLLALSSDGPSSAQSVSVEAGDIYLAIILVLFTYGGWSEISYVAEEVKNPKQNLFRALMFGTLCVTLIYLLVNFGFLHSLGHHGFASSTTVASDALKHSFPKHAGVAVDLFICISVLGAMNGMIFTGARVSYALGKDYRLFSRLSYWSTSRQTPTVALVLQCAISVLVLLLSGSFGETVVYTSSVVWLFFLLTGVSLFILRKNSPDLNRPYRVFAYPFTPFIFCISSMFLVYSAFVYDITGSLVAMGIMLIGLISFYCDTGNIRCDH